MARVWLVRGSAPAAKRRDLRFHRQQGIAVGPILFIIAIIALLGAAIAAGSGGFNVSTSNENIKSVAETIIQDSEQVYNSVQMLMANGCTETQLNFFAQGYIAANSNAPSDGSCNVFDMRGGRMIYMPLVSSFCYGASCTRTASDANVIPGVGTGVPQPIWMSYYISPAVCAQINTLLGITATLPVTSSITGTAYTGTFPLQATLASGYKGLTAACLYQGGYQGNFNIFYRVLFTR